MGKFRIVLVLTCMIILFGSFAFSSQIHTANAGTACNLSASVDQSSYNRGDIITLLFSTPSDSPASKVVITSNDPTGHVPYISTYYVNPGYSYSLKISTASSDWYASGSYYIKLQLMYPSGNVVYCAGVTPYFNFNAVSYQTPSAPPTSASNGNSVSAPPPSTSNGNSVSAPPPSTSNGNSDSVSPQNAISVDGTNTEITYTMTSGNVKDARVDTQSSSVVVSVNTPSDGTITLQIPRTLIDAKTNTGQDDSFIVLIDGADVKPQSESSNADYRTLTIPFLQGDQDIEIIGTQVVPEFGSIAPTILVISILSIIILSFKSRFLHRI